VRGGHPWVYDASITSTSHDGEVGDLAVVFDADRNFVAIGLWDPMSPIRIRILHRGRPATIDDAFWHDKLDAALGIRRPLAESGTTTGYRCVHGENDGLPGLVIDRYDDTYVVKIYSGAWLAHLDAVVGALDALVHPAAVVLRRSRRVGIGGEDGTALFGTVPDEPVLFMENGLMLEADVVHGQKTGHFLDQRDNRALVGSMSSGARVLDVFSCTGGFSVHAAAGGATSVTSVDQSTGALATAKHNMALNRDRAEVRACEHDSVAGDAFDVMATMARRGRHFDVVVVDPPSFASRASSVPVARRSYGRLTTQALALLEPGGLLVQASCSSRVSADDFVDTVFMAARAAGHHLSVVARTGHPLDHPVGFAEGAYLKALFARLAP